mmetsp:Transcript_24495/g.35972  ORF Transcript_24495/g.35972 Transcript_24495/m.35972 type:complete len:213 (-) Transcript_24495:418-1056(-)
MVEGRNLQIVFQVVSLECRQPMAHDRRHLQGDVLSIQLDIPFLSRSYRRQTSGMTCVLHLARNKVVLENFIICVRRKGAWNVGSRDAHKSTQRHESPLLPQPNLDPNPPSIFQSIPLKLYIRPKQQCRHLVYRSCRADGRRGQRRIWPVTLIHHPECMFNPSSDGDTDKQPSGKVSCTSSNKKKQEATDPSRTDNVISKEGGVVAATAVAAV